MIKPIIQILDLGKSYSLQTNQGKVVSIPGKVSSFFIGINEKYNKQDFWALQNISFEVYAGQVIGIIGRNGAGKSTLLKILSRITPPTKGEVILRGRVASLLEVGTGFHPELTGRENVFLNGAILGMSRKEIRSNYTRIVQFAELERFIDTKVKYYSSGMYARLAFSVAAHLEAEILLIDEVLAVGDTEFQKKCLDRMGQITKNGRTIIFVSHNMLAIKSLCSQCVELDKGKMVFYGSTIGAIESYLSRSKSLSKLDLINRSDRIGDGRIKFVKAWIENEGGKCVNTVFSGENIRLIAQYEVNGEVPLNSLSIAFALKDPLGNQLTDLWNKSLGCEWNSIPPKGIISCFLPNLPLNQGTYSFNLYASFDTYPSDWVQDAYSFSVVQGDFFGTGKIPDHSQGYFIFNQKWFIESV